MKRIVVLLTVLATACAPVTDPQRFAGDCRQRIALDRALESHWLQGRAVWRLRQSILLEAGPRKIALEGFLRLDLERREARLVAMNEVGLVLFDLQLDERGEQLNRAVPQLRKIAGLTRGIARSLRLIFFHPGPRPGDRREPKEDRQRLWHPYRGETMMFDYDCGGDLRTIRLRGQDEDWRVAYERYREYDGIRLPQQVAINDYARGLKLSLWVREARRE